MLSERKKRRALYWVTGFMWGVSACLAAHASWTESFVTRTVLLFVLALAGSLSTAALFAVFVAPLERVYRHGYEAGQHSRDTAPVTKLRSVGR